MIVSDIFRDMSKYPKPLQDHECFKWGNGNRISLKCSHKGIQGWIDQKYKYFSELYEKVKSLQQELEASKKREGELIEVIKLIDIKARKSMWEKGDAGFSCAAINGMCSGVLTNN